MATDHENALYAEASGLTSSWRETSNISRERIVAISFHVFMATCTLGVGVAWFELFASPSEAYTELPRFRAFVVFSASIACIYLGNFLAPTIGTS